MDGGRLVERPFHYWTGQVPLFKLPGAALLPGTDMYGCASAASPAWPRGTLFRTIPDSFARHRQSLFRTWWNPPGFRPPHAKQCRPRRRPAGVRLGIRRYRPPGTPGASAGHRRWGNSCVQAKQVSNRPSVACAAAGADGWLILRQDQQVGAGCRSNWNPERRENVRQQRIENEVGELFIVLGIVHAEAVLRSGSDDQFVDQRIAFTLDLLEKAWVLLPQRRAPHREVVAREVLP